MNTLKIKFIYEGEAAAVTIAYARSSGSDTTSQQWSKPAAGRGQGDGRRAAQKVRLPRHRQKVPPRDCSGKCCFACGKQGHFARNCALKNACHHISEEHLACEDKDHEHCECACAQHRHFLSADDRSKVSLVITVPAPPT